MGEKSKMQFYNNPSISKDYDLLAIPRDLLNKNEKDPSTGLENESLQKFFEKL